MVKTKNSLQRLKHWIQKTPDRKVYIEVVTAVLTIPVLLTVLITNYNNLTEKKEQAQNTAPAGKQEIIIKTEPSTQTPVTTAPVDTDDACRPEIGPITISYPQENQTVTDDPLNVIIRYSNPDYCSVVWSYRINNGTWSEYSSNSISIFGMTNGEKRLDLRVQSTVSQEQEIISRSFIYNGGTDPVATQSAQ